MNDDYIFNGIEICRQKETLEEKTLKREMKKAAKYKCYMGSEILYKKRRIKKMDRLKVGMKIKVSKLEQGIVTYVSGDIGRAKDSKSKLIDYNLSFSKDDRKYWVCDNSSIISKNSIIKGILIDNF